MLSNEQLQQRTEGLMELIQSLTKALEGLQDIVAILVEREVGRCEPK